MLHYALHCIASLPSSASDTPVPPLGLFYLAVQCSSGWSGAAGARALWPCSWSLLLLLLLLLLRGPSPVSPAQPIHCYSTRSMPADKFLLHTPSHLLCFTKHAPGRHGSQSPAQSAAQHSTPQHGKVIGAIQWFTEYIQTALW